MRLTLLRNRKLIRNILDRILGVFTAGLILCAVNAAHAQLTPPGGGSGGTNTVLDFWQFSNSNYLSGDGYSPLYFTNITLSASGDGAASALID